MALKAMLKCSRWHLRLFSSIARTSTAAEGFALPITDEQFEQAMVRRQIPRNARTVIQMESDASSLAIAVLCSRYFHKGNVRAILFSYIFMDTYEECKSEINFVSNQLTRAGVAYSCQETNIGLNETEEKMQVRLRKWRTTALITQLSKYNADYVFTNILNDAALGKGLNRLSGDGGVLWKTHDSFMQAGKFTGVANVSFINLVEFSRDQMKATLTARGFSAPTFSVNSILKFKARAKQHVALNLVGFAKRQLIARLSEHLKIHSHVLFTQMWQLLNTNVVLNEAHRYMLVTVDDNLNSQPVVFDMLMLFCMEWVQHSALSITHEQRQYIRSAMLTSQMKSHPFFMFQCYVQPQFEREGDPCQRTWLICYRKQAAMQNLQLTSSAVRWNYANFRNMSGSTNLCVTSAGDFETERVPSSIQRAFNKIPDFALWMIPVIYRATGPQDSQSPHRRIFVCAPTVDASTMPAGVTIDKPEHSMQSAFAARWGWDLFVDTMSPVSSLTKPVIMALPPPQDDVTSEESHDEKIAQA